jgi:hypothetical protein
MSLTGLQDFAEDFHDFLQAHSRRDANESN